MIVADRKSLQEILAMVEDNKKILISGCKGCVTVCNVGGLKEVEILASSMEIARKKVEYVKKTLTELGIEPERVEMYNLSSAQGARFAEIAREVVEIIRGLGPTPVKSDTAA